MLRTEESEKNERVSPAVGILNVEGCEKFIANLCNTFQTSRIYNDADTRTAYWQ